jgi:lytic murein transglycosylase
MPISKRFAFLAALALAMGGAAPTAPVIAQSVDMDFASYMQLLAARARGEGVSEATIRRMTTGLTPNPRVVQLDQSQPGSSSTTSSNTGSISFAPYMRTHVDAARINGGKRMYGTVASLAPAIEARYGVPMPILLAIWGHETNYGSYTGDFDLARSLATLAWEGRRRELFATEFVALLKMVDRGVPPEQLKGSWAGALGNPQFLPSMYLRLARDGDGDGYANIWSSRADTLASIANYFRDAGWKPGQPWAVRASVPSGFDAGPLANKLNAPECPRVHARQSQWRTVAEWRGLGVSALEPIGDGVLASLIEPDGRGAPAYLLTGNYRAILSYNCSNYYALSVGLLADAIAR